MRREEVKEKKRSRSLGLKDKHISKCYRNTKVIIFLALCLV